MHDWTEEELQRYSRQIVLREIGGIGQERLLAAKVALVGIGGIGAPAAMFLAAAGIGALRLIDEDVVELSNLHRQVLFQRADVGKDKVDAAASALRRANPATHIEAWPRLLDRDNVLTALADVDLVLDGTDRFDARRLVADACADLRTPLVSASVQGFDGQLIVLRPYLGPPHPSHRCLFPDVPRPDLVPNCSLSGVLGTVPATIAAIASTEAIKLLLDLDEPGAPAPLICYDALTATMLRIEVPRTPAAEQVPPGVPGYAST